MLDHYQFRFSKMQNSRLLSGIFYLILAVCLPLNLTAIKKQTEENADLSEPHFLAIFAVFKNEAPWLKEWIEYHHMLGVSHFFLYNNGSTDEYLKVLKPYIKKGLVELIYWPDQNIEFPDLKKRWAHSTQISAFMHALQKAQDNTKWLAILDIDEFIVPKTDSNLIEFLNDYEEYAGVVINWQIFGTSYVEDIPKNKLMIETLLLKHDPNFAIFHFAKSIVKPDLVIRDCLTQIYAGFPHYIKYKEGSCAVWADKSNFVLFDYFTHIDRIQINHYYFRTINYFENVKNPQNILLNKYTYMNPEIYNEVEDDSILRFTEALRKKMGLK